MELNVQVFTNLSFAPSRHQPSLNSLPFPVRLLSLSIFETRSELQASSVFRAYFPFLTLFISLARFFSVVFVVCCVNIFHCDAAEALLSICSDVVVRTVYLSLCALLL